MDGDGRLASLLLSPRSGEKSDGSGRSARREYVPQGIESHARSFPPDGKAGSHRDRGVAKRRLVAQELQERRRCRGGRDVRSDTNEHRSTPPSQRLEVRTPACSPVEEESWGSGVRRREPPHW